MKRSFSLSSALAVGTLAVLTAAPALASEYSYDYGTPAGEGVGAVVCGIYACAGVFALLALAFWIWMLVDLISRQEYEFPNSTGSSKTIWLVVMLASWLLSAYFIAALVYYFMVFKKIKRGRGGQPPQAGPTGGYQPPPAPPQAPPVAPPAPPVAPPAPPVAPPAPPVAPPAPPAPPVPPAPPAPPTGPVG